MSNNPEEDPRYPGEPQHLPHEAWHTEYNRVRREYPQHFDENGNPNPGAEQHLPHEAWHTVRKVANGNIAPPPFQ